MTTRDWVVFISTFIFGLFVGAYVYLLGFAPNYRLPETQDRPDEEARVLTGFEIMGEVYGSCAYTGCAAFWLERDRIYQYTIIAANPEFRIEPITGRLEEDTYRAIGYLLTPTRLSDAAETLPGQNCSVLADKTHYRFTVIVDTTEYDLDTCDTGLAADSALQEVLIALFGMISDPSTAPNSF